MDEEGALLIYENTDEYNFPLILIIGREANNNRKIIYKVDKYDFSEPRSTLWYNSLRFILASQIEETNIAYFKVLGEKILKKMQSKRASFICFADISPFSLNENNSDEKKITERTLIYEKKPECFLNHCRNIFKMKIMQRVQLIIFTGITESNGVSQALLDFWHDTCEGYKKDYFDIQDYLGNVFIDVMKNCKDIQKHKQQIYTIIQQWVED